MYKFVGLNVLYNTPVSSSMGMVASMRSLIDEHALPFPSHNRKRTLHQHHLYLKFTFYLSLVLQFATGHIDEMKVLQIRKCFISDFRCYYPMFPAVIDSSTTRSQRWSVPAWSSNIFQYFLPPPCSAACDDTCCVEPNPQQHQIHANNIQWTLSNQQFNFATLLLENSWSW